MIAFLRRHLRSVIAAAFAVAALLGGAFALWSALGSSGRTSDAFYTPGVTPNREDCFYAKMKIYNRVDKQLLASIALECELTVQSIEGHERLRKAWEERQATRQAEPKPPPPPAEPPAEPDRLRRVWR